MKYVKNPFIWLMFIASLTSCMNKTDEQSVSDSVMPVKVQPFQYSLERIPNTYVGIIEESQSIPLSFLTTGTTEKVLADEGDKVSKGQLLASLNSFSYQKTYESAVAKEKQAQDAYDRLLAVYKNGSLPEVKMVEIETGLEQARSLVQIAKKSLDDCDLYAPVSGVVGKRSLEPGMNVVPGTPVLTLVNIEKVYVKISVPENEIAGIHLGQEIVISVSALKHETFTGKVEQKGVIANPLSHTYEVKAGISNRGDQLRPGMVCNVSLNNNNEKQYMAIPRQVVQIDNANKSYVYIADTIQNKAVRKYIVTGSLLINSQIEIASGLEKGDLVITDGYQKIHENSPVQIIR